MPNISLDPQCTFQKKKIYAKLNLLHFVSETSKQTKTQQNLKQTKIKYNTKLKQ